MDSLGAPRYRLAGSENRVGFILRECDSAAEGQPADLSWLWPNV
jgi:hypothetical protein